MTTAIPLEREMNGASSMRRGAAQFVDFPNEQYPAAPEKALAAGVLRQTAADLRRFREAKDTVGREFYADACAWLTSADREWPYSFRNICDSLGLDPETVREEIFADVTSGWAVHSSRIAWATALQLVGSVSHLFLTRRHPAVTAARL